MRPKVTGIAVVTASRIAALAGPGEVLVSSTIEELVAGSGVEFADRGFHPLKGVSGEKHLFAVRAVDGDLRTLPLDEATSNERLAGIASPTLGRRYRPWIVGAGVLVGIGAGTLAGTIILSNHPKTYIPGTDTVARIDAASHAFARPIPVGQLPTGIAFAGGDAWVINQGDSTIERIEPTSSVTTPPKSTQGVPTGIAGGKQVSSSQQGSADCQGRAICSL